MSATATQGATGHGSFVLLFKNVSGSTCSVTGFPGLDALNGSGQILAHAQRTLSGFMGRASAVATVDLAPGGFASATVEWLNFNPVTTADCTFSTRMAATPANTTHTVHRPVSVSICQLQVHPTVAGTSGQGSGTPSQVPAGSGGLAATNDSGTEQPRIVLAAIGGTLLLLGAAAIVRSVRRHRPTPACADQLRRTVRPRHRQLPRQHRRVRCPDLTSLSNGRCAAPPDCGGRRRPAGRRNPIIALTPISYERVTRIEPASSAW